MCQVRCEWGYQSTCSIIYDIWRGNSCVSQWGMRENDSVQPLQQVSGALIVYHALKPKHNPTWSSSKPVPIVACSWKSVALTLVVPIHVSWAPHGLSLITTAPSDSRKTENTPKLSFDAHVCCAAHAIWGALIGAKLPCLKSCSTLGFFKGMHITISPSPIHGGGFTLVMRAPTTQHCCC